MTRELSAPLDFSGLDNSQVSGYSQIDVFILIITAAASELDGVVVHLFGARAVGGARAGLQPGELPAAARLGRRVHERRDRETAPQEVRVSWLGIYLLGQGR